MTKTSTPLLAALTLLLACGGGAGDDADAGPGADAAADAAPDAPPLRCNDLSPLPVSATVMMGFSGSEDFAFDADGSLVSTDPSGNLTRQGKTGQRSLILPNLGDTAGTAFLPNGDLVIASVTEGAVLKVTPDGSRSTLISNLQYPNGLAVGQTGLVYVAEHDAGRVLEVDASGNMTPIATGLLNPNGLSFSPDYETLYVGSFGGGTMHRIESDGSGGWGAVQLLGNVNSGGFEGGGLDGVAVDGCGNVYITEYIHGKIWRLPSTGGTPELASQLPSSWIPNMHWGTGLGGWSRDILYVMDRDEGRIFELDFGVAEKPIVFP